MAEKPKKIHLIGSGRREEARAAAAITPGHLIELASSGKVQKHSGAGAVAERNYALEDALQGNTIDDDYSSDDLVSFLSAAPGDVIYGWLAAGENASIGSKLTSNGDGTFKVAAGSDLVAAVATEAVDNSASGASSAMRIKARVL